MATNGNNVLIYVGGSLVAGTRSDEVQTDGGLIEISINFTLPMTGAKSICA